MHNLILGKRNAGAMQRILTTSKALAEYYKIDPALASALKVQEKDPIVRAMKEREAVADLLDSIGLELGLIKVEVAEVSDVPDDADASRGEGLPEPREAVEGAPADGKKSKKSKQAAE
jgi:hypothetical protein